jgi:hypothetical protein
MRRRHHPLVGPTRQPHPPNRLPLSLFYPRARLSLPRAARLPPPPARCSEPPIRCRPRPRAVSPSSLLSLATPSSSLLHWPRRHSARRDHPDAAPPWRPPARSPGAAPYRLDATAPAHSGAHGRPWGACTQRARPASSSPRCGFPSRFPPRHGAPHPGVLAAQPGALTRRGLGAPVLAPPCPAQSPRPLPRCGRGPLPLQARGPAMASQPWRGPAAWSRRAARRARGSAPAQLVRGASGGSRTRYCLRGALGVLAQFAVLPARRVAPRHACGIPIYPLGVPVYP